jgi:uncharacterized membrane protein YuzA (DUF378 family)
MTEDRNRPSASAFLTRFSRVFLVVVGLLAVVSIANQLRDFYASSPETIPGANSAQDIAIFERLNVVVTFFTVVVWSFLVYTAWSFLKRRNWSRPIVLGLVGLAGLAAVWWAIMFSLVAIGAFTAPGPPNASAEFKLIARVTFGVLGAAMLALGYLSWRLIAKLRAPEVRSAFRGDET